MAKIHVWGLEDQYRIRFERRPVGPPQDPVYILFLDADGRESDVAQHMSDADWPMATYVVAPDKGNSRDNSITAANTRRLTHDTVPVVVPIRGASRRERLDFVSWLVENDYVPAFPRFQPAGRSLPLGRQRQVAELRELMDRLGPWNWAVLDYTPSEPATPMFEAADVDGRIEAFLGPGRVQIIPT